MNIANQFTLARLALTVAFVATAQFAQDPLWRWTAVVLATAAGVTDFFDGWLARRYNLVTDFGKLMDPLADKIFVTALLFVFVEKNTVPAWAAILILMRELAVTGLRQVALQKGLVLEASGGGKIKTTLQFIWLGLVGAAWAWYGTKTQDQSVQVILFALMLATVLVTVYTGLRYFIDHRKLYGNQL